MKDLLPIFLFLFITPLAYSQTVADFTMTDINGQSHSLYADYLDQGKAVFISAAATWNPWDSVWVDSGVLDDFQAQYGNDAVILFIEADPNTPESDLYGTGGSGTYDFVTGHDYIIIDDSDGFLINQYGLSFFPSVYVICPDGTGYTQAPGNSNFEVDDEVFYGTFDTADKIADKLFERCGIDFDRSKLEGIVYTDMDNDCDQTGENPVPMMIASIDGPTGSFYRVTDNQGTFRALADEGTYTVEFSSPNNLWDVCDNPQSYTFGSTQDSVFLDFGLQALMECTEPVVEISAPVLIRCFESSIYVHYCNEGTIPVDDVIVTVTLDSFLQVNNISQMASSQNGFTYTFDIGTLGVFECGDIVFDIIVDCDAELGTEQCYSAHISPDPGCNNSLLALSEECQDIVGSYDPNDKRAFPYQDSDEYVIGPNEIIKYQVRFQNTGTFMAFKVEVLDSISPLMDLSTFRMGVASHNYEVAIEDNRTLKVTFDNINLPDSSSNEAESHGFFTYYLQQMPDLPEGSQISNRAGIYFDFNDPIITNTTVHTIDYNIVSNQEVSKNDLDFNISPNPTSDIIYIAITDPGFQTGNYSLLTPNGQQVAKGSFSDLNFEIPIGNISQGIYFLQISDTNGNLGIKKVFVY